MLILIFLICLTLTNDVSTDNNEVNCTVYRKDFGTRVSIFTSCAIENSHPIKLCEACVDPYIDVQESYRNLSIYKDDKGDCLSHFINLDRLGIIVSIYESVYNLWNRAKCYECFVIENGFLTHNSSNETVQFNQFYDVNQKCMNKTYNKISDMCDKCMDSYFTLNDYYESISDQNANIGMCMDIVDLMNTTRTYWSENCCRYRRHNEYAFIGTVTGIFAVTILFYVLTKLFVDKQSPKIFQHLKVGDYGILSICYYASELFLRLLVSTYDTLRSYTPADLN